MAPKKKPLAQELADLLTPGPAREHDPDALELGDGAALQSDDEDLGDRKAPSRLAPEKPMRLRGDIALEDEAYRGRRTSRAAVFGEQDEAGDEEEDGDEEEVDGFLGSEGDGEDEEGEEEEEEADGRAAKRSRVAAGGAAGSEDGDDQLPSTGDGEDEDDEDLMLGGSEGDMDDMEEEEDGERGRAGASGRGREGADGGGRRRKAAGGGGGELDDLEAELEALQHEDEAQLAALREKGERDRVKGVAVRNQQVVYERVLEQRILLQRCLQASNGLPRPHSHALLRRNHPEAAERYAQLASAARSTLEDLLSLQHALMDRHPSITAPNQQQQSPAQQPDPASEGGEDEDGAGTSTSTSSTDALWARISSHHASLSAFHCPALDSWHRRTVLASGAGALRNRGLRALAQSVSSQVAAIMRDPAKFIKRTRLPVSSCPRVLGEPPRATATATANGDADGDADGLPLVNGHAAAAASRPLANGGLGAEGLGGQGGMDEDGEEERDPETYDDSEFYAQLLKEFLDKGMAGAAAGAPKASKKRKQVDRRASKGRKLRYHVQDKLVAFMAPVDFELPPFAANLFANLFGHAGK